MKLDFGNVALRARITWTSAPWLFQNSPGCPLFGSTGNILAVNERTDSELLRAYAETGSESAFAELVSRHVVLVYCVARRVVVDTHLAEDVTQATFATLAREARHLAGRTFKLAPSHGFESSSETGTRRKCDDVRVNRKRLFEDWEIVVLAQGLQSAHFGNRLGHGRGFGERDTAHRLCSPVWVGNRQSSVIALIANPQPANWALAPVENLLIRCGSMNGTGLSRAGEDRGVACGCFSIHARTAAQKAAHLQVSSPCSFVSSL